MGLGSSRHISKTDSTQAKSSKTHRSWRREPFSPEGHLCQRPGREKDRPRGLWGGGGSGRRETSQRPDLEGPPVPADAGLHSGSRHFRKAVLWFSNRGSHTLATPALPNSATRGCDAAGLGPCFEKDSSTEQRSGHQTWSEAGFILLYQILLGQAHHLHIVYSYFPACTSSCKGDHLACKAHSFLTTWPFRESLLTPARGCS